MAWCYPDRGLLFFVQRREGWTPVANPDGFSRRLDLKGSYYDQAAHQTIVYQRARDYFGGPLMFGAGLIAGLLGIGARALKVLTYSLFLH